MESAARKKDIDWGSLGFSYHKTDYSYACNYRDGAWDAGGLTSDHTIVMSECAGILHYCQEIFEGLKAYTTKDGEIVCFRPDMNASRMVDSAKRLAMPPFPEDRFVAAIKETIRANAAWVPPFGSGASLYIRPYMFATGNVIGLAPANEYQFRILVTPVAPYFKSATEKFLSLRVSPFDRAAPRGTGGVKAGLNYAMSLYSLVEAHAMGFDDNLYLDAQTRTYLEEASGANILLATSDKTLVVPESLSDSILPSITRRSLVELASDLGIKVTERRVALEELFDGAYAECGLCGTAAVVSPVGRVVDGDRVIEFSGAKQKEDSVMMQLRELLTGIQMGTHEDTHNWVVKVCSHDEL